MAKEFYGGKIVLLTNDARASEHPPAKEWSWIAISHCPQKSTQN